MILSALGVEHSYILEDYLKTNEQRKPLTSKLLRNIKQMERLQQKFNIRNVALCEKEYLATALQAIEKNLVR